MSYSIAAAVRLAVPALVLAGSAWLAPGVQLRAEMAVLTDPRGVSVLSVGLRNPGGTLQPGGDGSLPGRAA